MAKKTVEVTTEDFVVEEQPVQESLASLEHKAAQETRKIERERQKMLEHYLAEEKVAVMVSPMYAPFLGKIVRCAVNTIMVEVPANGQSYQVNKTHASHIIAKIRNVDAMLARQQKAGDVQANFERSPGELHI